MMLKLGTKVQTNDAYLSRFGRRVFGVITEGPGYGGLPESDLFTFVSVKRQDGNSIPEYFQHTVLFLTRDLDEVSEL